MSLHYLPDISLNSIKELVCNNTDSLYRELDAQKYERIGLDRAYMILDDIMTNYGSVSGYSVLDVGCNNGLFSDLFSYYGNAVTGIDNFAIDRQNRYDSLNFSANSLSKFMQTDVCDFIASTDDRYDFIFLLSVAHQWEYGYAHTGDFKKDDKKISYIITSLFDRAVKAVYYECPMDEPGFAPGYGIEFLSRYLEQYENTSIVKISDTIASNGYIRSLYRITHVCPNNLAMSNETNTYDKLVSLQQTYCIDGEIVNHGSAGGTKYAIYNGKSLTVSLLGNKRDHSHPWGVQKTPESVFNLWKKIKDSQPEHIVKVEKLYTEGFAQIEVVQGAPCMRTPQIPGWQKRNYYVSQRACSKLPFWLLTQMCLGLGELHTLGIAHGDPYPYNAIFDKHKVKWVDLGNISNDKQEIRKDISTFFLYTFPYILFQYGKISCQMVELLGKEIMTNDDIQLTMKKAAAVFSEVYTDEKNISEQDIPFLFNCIHQIVDKHLLPDDRYLLDYQAYKYHTDTVTWMNSCDLHSEAHKFAGLARQFSQLENARSRLSIDCHLSQISEYERQMAEIKQKVSELEELQQGYKDQIEHLNKKISLQEENEACRQKELLQTIYSLEQQNNELRGVVSFQKKHLSLLTDTIVQYEKLFQA